MTEHTAIEWTDHTFSPWLGCTPVSAACDHCYAAALARRYGWPEYRAGVPRRLTAASTWKLPLRWQKKAAANGVRASVFPSLCDPYDSEGVDKWRDGFMGVIEATPDLDWLLLTKRPQLAAKYHRRRPMPANVCLGVTAENQAMADLRIPQLLEIPGPKLRFVSIEPMLEAVDLRAVRWGHATALTGLDWVIAGGESGLHARPSHPAWFRALRDQCLAAGVAFFFKQWGDWLDVTDSEQGRSESRRDQIITPAGETIGVGVCDRGKMLGTVDTDWRARGAAWLSKVGKHAAGAELDGRLWRQFPPQLRAAPLGVGATVAPTPTSN